MAREIISNGETGAAVAAGIDANFKRLYGEDNSLTISTTGVHNLDAYDVHNRMVLVTATGVTLHIREEGTYPILAEATCRIYSDQSDTQVTVEGVVSVNDLTSATTLVAARVYELVRLDPNRYSLGSLNSYTTLAELNAILTDATLIDTNDPRLSDSRTPTSHTHTGADVIVAQLNVSSTRYLAASDAGKFLLVDCYGASRTIVVDGALDASFPTGTRIVLVKIDDSANPIEVSMTGGATVSGYGQVSQQYEFKTLLKTGPLAWVVIKGGLDASAFATLAKLNAIVSDATLDDAGDPRDPKAHTQTASTITDFDTEVANNAAVAANTAKETNATHTGDATGSTALSVVGLRGVPLDATAGSPGDGDILVFRSAGGDWVLEAKPAGGSGDELIDLAMTAGEALTAGDVVYLSSNGKVLKTDASAEASAAHVLVGIALATVALDAAVDVRVYGEYTTSGLTIGAAQYLSETAGALTETSPTADNTIVRVFGYALSPTVLFICPDPTSVENLPDEETRKMAGALSDETSDLTTGIKFTEYASEAFTATRFFASLVTAAVGANFQIDVKKNGVSILSAVLAVTAGTNYAETTTFASTAVAKNDKIEVEIIQIGTTTAGAGAKFSLFGT